MGYLFTSQAFREGKSELVFFITPEIIDPRNNNQNNILLEKKDSINNVNSDAVKNYMDRDEKSETKINSSNTNKENDNSEHEKKVKDILGN